MGDPKTVLEGCVKYRDKKKWKTRWAVVSKLSPVADCLHLQLYRDSKERCKNGPTKASLSLEGFLGMETGFTLDKESNTMALICSELVVVLAFDSRELLIQWQVKIRGNLTEEQQFLVQISHVPTKSKLSCGPARLHLQDYTFCLVAGVPPRLLGTWPIKELRRFGVIEGKFCFEGGSLCGKGEGLHILLTNQSQELAHAMDLASKGKLLGKRKTLSRKNSVLESSTRTSLHKSSRHSSDKCSTTDSSRPLLSSGSESSTCDACSEILRSSDPLGGCDDHYLPTVTKAASACRIHYRWPSCMSRWGQSSTVTASDVESMDTVSVTLSDYQGAAHSTVSSKGNGHGSSLLCLCDGQGTWPFNHCTKCGRQFYSRSSLGHQNGIHSNRPPISPDHQTGDGNNGFSPQWTMDAALPSPSTEVTCSNVRKDSAYQVMQPSSDRASLCSHTSRSSSTSTASSSGSEYSVPRNYLEALYDKPRALHLKNGGCISNHKNAVFNGIPPINPHVNGDRQNASRGQSATDNTIVCPCHEPISDWKVSQNDHAVRPPCSCWNQLSLSMRSEKEVRLTVSPNPRSASANPSPSSSPKKVQYNSSASTIRTNTVSIAAVSQATACTCHKGDPNPYMHYAVPRMAIASMLLKEKQLVSGHINNSTHLTENPFQTAPSEEYDIPKKFADMHFNSEVVHKPGSSCKCKNWLKPPAQKAFETYISNHRYDSPSSENTIQMCTCQRVMLWAGSFVPCLGVPPPNTTEQGWQCEKGVNIPIAQSQAISNRGGTICCEPHRISELVLVNGKPKHVLHGQQLQSANNGFTETKCSSSSCGKSTANKSLPGSVTRLNEQCSSDNDSICNYVNIEFPNESLAANEKPKFSDDSAVNYANLEFTQTTPFYENSNSVLNRLEQSGENKVPSIEKPPLPPRGHTSSSKSSSKIPRCNTIENSKYPTGKLLHDHGDVAQTAIKHLNGSIYELMCFEKQNPGTFDDDYLMMQPVYPRNCENKIEKLSENQEPLPSTSALDSKGNKQRENGEEDNDLPLRPFMPFSYPHLEYTDLESSLSDVLKTISPPVDTISRRHRLINEDMEIRSARSNSLSELKKIVLLRKRSCSVDGKANVPVFDSEIKSNPASPLASPRSYIQRKNSLFSKLSLRSKEKSMSTNEIIPPAVLPSTASNLIGYRRNTLHRSADCLKLNEECANSDDDLSTDLYEISQKEVITMRRSSSVPCRSAMPGNLPSPRTTNVSIIPEMNDLNKDSSIPSANSPHASRDHGYPQRKYSLDSQEKPKRTLLQEQKSICDNAYKQACLSERCDPRLETSAIFGRSTNHLPEETLSILDPYKGATSSSSSDTSDFVESLTHCSRSSSSSSGSTSSSDYMRSEDIYLQRPNVKSSVPRNSTKVFGPAIPPHRTRLYSHDDSEYHHSHANHVIPSSKDESFLTPNHRDSDHHYELTKKNSNCKTANPLKSSDPVIISNSSGSVVTCKTVNGTRARSGSKSPTSSTSSLSTSPSTTDYSSSSSGNCSIPGQRTVPIRSHKESVATHLRPIPTAVSTSADKLVVKDNYSSTSDTSSSLTDCNVDV